jgi:dTDP-4-amino-4,6-dideoxygalactose transaminase
MFALGSNPNNRLYTDLNSYTQFLGHVLGGRSRNGETDIEKFEHALCERLGAQHALCVYQCRVGIYLAVKAVVEPGQEVILSPYTMTDVVNMVYFAGGRPVFADVDRDTCNISATEVEKLIGPKTGAVLITHLHGVAADAHRIRKICDRFGVPMLEDCAQAFGVLEKGKAVGTIGDVGIFSFEMHKNLATWLGGAIVTDRQDVIETCRAELEHFDHPPLPGIVRKIKSGLINDLARSPGIFQLLTYPIIRFGRLKNIEAINNTQLRKPQESVVADALPDVYKSRFMPFLARIGLSRMKYIDSDIKTRIENGMLYYEGLQGINELVLPPPKTDGSNSFLWFPIQCARRDELIRFLFEHGRDVAAGHFVNNANAPRFEEFSRDCPNAEAVENELIYLPTYPSYSRRAVERNIDLIRQFFNMPPLYREKINAAAD